MHIIDGSVLVVKNVAQMGLWGEVWSDGMQHDGWLPDPVSPRFPFPFTALPNRYFDEWMRLLSPTATVVMLAIYRETLGWRRMEAMISLDQFRLVTGISSYSTISRALQELLLAGLVQVKDQRGPHGLKCYRLTAMTISSTEVGGLPPLSRSTVSGKEPLQNLERYPYKNRKPTSTDSVARSAAQPAQDKAPRKSKEREKDTVKERRKQRGCFMENKEKSVSSPPEPSPPLPVVGEVPSEPLAVVGDSSTQQDAPLPAGQEAGAAPPASPVSASEEKNVPVEEDERAQAERVGLAAARRWLLAELAETRQRARDYRLRSTERLRARERLLALEWSWRQEFPDEPLGGG
jgi:hypothetical protein